MGMETSKDVIPQGRYKATIVDVECNSNVRFGNHISDVYKPVYSIDDDKLTALSYKLAQQFVDQIEEKDKLKDAINQSVIEHYDDITTIDMDKLKSMLGMGSEGLHSMEELVDECMDDEGDIGLGFIDMFDVDKPPPPLEGDDDSETRFF